VPSTFLITSGAFMPSNSSTASEIALLFTFTLTQSGGQYIQLSFGQQNFVPSYSQLLPIEVTLNDQPANIVDLTVQQSGFYWAPIDKLIFVLPNAQTN
jgi:hypothetical protein